MMLTEIIYKGSVIGTVAPGESKILKCNGKKMTDDVTIKAGERTEIRVDGAVIAVAKAGETKTIKCAGKTMKSNIEIRVEDDIPGKDGVSPTVEMIDIEGGTRLIITDVNGPKSTDIMDGKDGSNGVGIKSVVQTTTSSLDGGSNVITVTKTDNTTSTFTVKNGREGSDGKDGYTPIKGVDYFDGSNGRNGADGKTPVKGTDYFTSADKAELINAIKGSLTLGIASDGLIYLFVDGAPVGTGIPQGQSGDVFGYVDENNTIVLNGNLADGTYTLKYEMSNGDIVNIGNMVLDSTVYYTVTSNLTNCSISNSTKTVAQGSSYSATITANSGYELKSVTVTMGGSAVSVSGGVINIASVTGNIVITATAEEAAVTPAYTNLFVPSEAQINKRINSSKSIVAQDGYVISNFIDVSDKVPFTSSAKIYVKGATITADGNTKLMTFKSTDGVLTSSYTMQNGSALTVNNLGNGVISISPDASWFVSGIQRMLLVLKVSDSAITAADIQDLVITIDEPIA